MNTNNTLETTLRNTLDETDSYNKMEIMISNVGVVT